MAFATNGTARSETSAATRERLLRVAERLFAEEGFASVSVRRITAQAGCNLAAVNYHFGGKLGLYREAFRRRLAITRDRRIAAVRSLAEAPGAELTVESILRVFAEAFVEPFVADSEGRLLLRLIRREMVEPQLPPGMFRAELGEPVRRALAQALAAVVPRIAPRTLELCIESLIAQLVNVLNMQRFARVEGEPVEPWLLEEITDHIVTFTSAGIRACAGRASR